MSLIPSKRNTNLSWHFVPSKGASLQYDEEVQCSRFKIELCDLLHVCQQTKKHLNSDLDGGIKVFSELLEEKQLLVVQRPQKTKVLENMNIVLIGGAKHFIMHKLQFNETPCFYHCRVQFKHEKNEILDIATLRLIQTHLQMSLYVIVNRIV